MIERALILATGSALVIDPELVSAGPASAPGGSLLAVERDHIQRVLEQTSGVIEGANGTAQILDMHPNTLRSRMKKLGIHRTAADQPSGRLP